MLESAGIGQRLWKQVCAREEPKLREALLDAPRDPGQSGRGPALRILSSVETGGRAETANRLVARMDPRNIRVRAFAPRTPEEAALG